MANFLTDFEKNSDIFFKLKYAGNFQNPYL